ncbi:uncharacterized protein LOC125065123 [Vanessa atalanta]|uniref:uncharacterized protein LOC125065123 n=1 Tax=Vanessa atalanta TaxID=42275 RepID=UPI001FCDFCF8|nr:uncharacterized protein LOC125065123 [Vanessa atalanta]
MQLLHEQTSILTVKDIGNVHTSLKDASSHNIEVKEKRSSNASIFVMNPVASGDNMQIDLNSAQKIKDETVVMPQLVPCCEGKELQINEDLVRTGLSAISVKHDSVVQCLSMSCACERMQVPPGLVKHRNSFRSLHRPDLKRVPYLRRMTPDELESLFRGYADIPTRGKKRETPKETFMVLPPDENDRSRKVRDKTNLEEGGNLHPIPETRSCADDVPAGMRLHGARARLYTSVLAGAKAGDQLDNASANDDCATPILADPIPEDEIPLYEELQIILPPRCDDVTAGSSHNGSEKKTFE